MDPYGDPSEPELRAPEPIQASKLHGYLTVSGGFFIHLFCGCLYLWGSIQNYVLSYYHNIVKDESVSPDMVSLIITLSMFSMSLTNYFGAWLQKRILARYIMAIGSVIMLLGVFIASLCTSWWPFVFFYAFVYPLGIGVVYYVPIICGWEWFPEKRGFATGAVVSGFGLGSFFFGFLTTAIANPNNLRPHTLEVEGDTYFPDEVAENVPKMLRICLIFWFILCLIGIFTVRRNPDYVLAQ